MQIQLNSKFVQIVISGFLLWLFAVIGTTLVAFTQVETQEQIAANERMVLLRNLYILIPEQKLDNDIAQDTLEIPASERLGTEKPSIVYRARKNGEPVAAIFNAIAPDGYSGKIYLLIAVYNDGTLAGVRAVKHNETPGLGDAIDVRKSKWILGFDGKSLGNPVPEKWKVKRDGGDFDQITGATITPRAIVKAVKNTLDYFQANREKLFQ
jgi:Na+-translocating ferredoxin:NAD+ oxidoreductase subunit G